VDDLALIKAITSGDRDAFRRIVERETPPVFRTCYRILGRLDEAEDVTQETFVTAYRAIDTYRGDGSLGAWLARIAARRSLRRLAQRPPVAPLDPIIHDRADAAPDPLGVTLATEREAMVRGAVLALPEPYREVVALRFFGELSLNEIALVTDRPLSTVKTQVRRGLARLRPILAEEVAA
jgi:RNA polymerase sigma-70 factor (ECF subfamily)